MCVEPQHRPSHPVPSVVRSEPAAALDDPVALSPVDAVTLTTLVDNSIDLLLADQGPVKRHGMLAGTRAPRLACGVLDTGETFDFPLA